MFRFLKEALADVPPSSSQHPPARRASSALAPQTKPVRKLEDDATEEDLLVKTYVETLKEQNDGPFDPEKVGEVGLTRSSSVSRF
jgi:hypothetical protein